MHRDVTLLWALRSPCAFACPHCYFGTIEEHKDNPPGQAGALSHLSRTDLPANGPDGLRAYPGLARPSSGWSSPEASRWTGPARLR